MVLNTLVYIAVVIIVIILIIVLLRFLFGVLLVLPIYGYEMQGLCIPDTMSCLYNNPKFAVNETTNYSQTNNNNTNFTNAIKALEGKECPMLPSSEISSFMPLRQMRCHVPECQLYFFSGNYTPSREMDEKCYEPAEDRTLGSLVS
jgi:hypothetical protein